jgi:UDP-N-acetylmuramate--alanine ligase
VVRRAEMLAELMRLKSNVAVAGTHGKTTTTTMVATLLDAGGLDPTVVNGGVIHRYASNARMGRGEWMVVEADESDGTFNRLPATIAVVTNIDPEHMEHWGSIEALRRGFHDFVSNIPFYGLAVCCTDHPEVQALVGRITDRRVRTFGFNAQADVRATQPQYETGSRASTCSSRPRGTASTASRSLCPATITCRTRSRPSRWRATSAWRATPSARRSRASRASSGASPRWPRWGA